MSNIYSLFRYLLYEPVLRIGIAQGYSVRCEVAVPAVSSNKGDKKRIDFILQREDTVVGLELKWAKTKKINILNNVEKLKAYANG